MTEFKTVEELADEFAHMFPEIQEEWSEFAVQVSVMSDAIFYGSRQHQYKQMVDLNKSYLQLAKKMTKVRSGA